MEKLSAPSAMLKLGIKYPDIYIVKPKERKLVPAGTPFIVSSKPVDEHAIWLTILMPLLRKRYKYINWQKVYQQQTGKPYADVKFEMWCEPDGSTRNCYGEGTDELQHDPDWDVGNCLGKEAEVSIDVLSELELLPHFLEDIREAIKVNLTQMYAWQDGYNKKLGLCSGYMEEQPANRNLMIVDISSSIPRGVSSALLMLVKTMTDICNADLIITASRSVFWDNEDVPFIDEDWVNSWSRGNEGTQFAHIIADLDLTAYTNLICFGDSDSPYEISEWKSLYFYGEEVDVMSKPCDFKMIHSFWVTGWRQDRYGRNHEDGAGYCRWARELNPSIPIEHHLDWLEVFR